MDIINQPAAKNTKRDSATETDLITIEVTVLKSINNKLSILELLHTDIKEPKASLEFTESQIDTPTLENNKLKGTVKNLSAQILTLTQENRNFKNTILDL